MEPVTPSALAEEVRRRIADLGDPGKAPAMQSYMRSVMPYRGVTAAPLARLLKEIYGRQVLESEEDWTEAVLELWDGAEYREERYAATTLARHRTYSEHQQPHTVALYRHLVVSGAWWDHVDEVSHLVGGLLRSHGDAVRPKLLDWAVEDDMWLRRSAVICQVGHRERIDRELLVSAIEANLDGSDRRTPPLSRFGNEFFIRKAIGWALRDHARTDPDWVRRFLAEHSTVLSGLSRREAARHL